MGRRIFQWVLAVVACLAHLSFVPSATAAVRSTSQKASAEPLVWNAGALGSQAAALQKAWAANGEAQRLRPRMLQQGTAFPLTFPRESLNPEDPGCTTLAILGASNVSFLLVFSDQETEASRRAWPVPSAAGLAEVTRCGARKPLLKSLELKMRSRRGVLEFVLLQAEHPPLSATEILRGRDAGPSLASPQVGKRPWLAPVTTRLRTRIDAYRGAGAHQIRTSVTTSDARGRGAYVVHLAAGCHRIDLLADAHPDAPPDLDAQLSSVAQAEVLTSDEEHRGEVSLMHCVGRPGRFRISYTGGQPNTEIRTVQAQWPLPEGLPIAWGPVARAHLSRAIWDRGFPALADQPTFAALGVRGATRTVVQVDPEACYLAAVAHIRGEAPRLALGAEGHGQKWTAQSPHSGAGASFSFCSNGAERVPFEIHGVGSGLAWILGVWEIPGGGQK